MEAEQTRNLQMHITKLNCKRCIYFKRKDLVFICTTRNDKHLKYQPLIIKALDEVCALYEDIFSTGEPACLPTNTIKYFSKMNASAKHDILELMKLTLLELQPIALQWKVDTLDKKKQDVIYAILDAQASTEAV